MSYPREFRDKVRDAWLSGRYVNLMALCKEFGIRRSSTIYQWRKRDRWDDLQQRATERAVEESGAVYSARIKEVTENFWKLWNVVLQAAATRIRDSEQPGAERRLTLGELEILSRILDRAQHGQRTVLGIDDARGGKREPSEGMVEELTITYETLGDAIKRIQAGGNGDVPQGGEPAIMLGGRRLFERVEPGEHDGDADANAPHAE